MYKVAWEKVQKEEEKLFLKQVESYSIRADKQNRNFYTDFYAVEWMEEVLEKYIGMKNLYYPVFLGGYAYAQRQVLGIVPRPEEQEEQPFSILEVTVKTGLGKELTHRDFLGALLGLGIERCKIGDILIQPPVAYIMIKQEIEDYVRWNLTQVGRYKQLEIKEVSEALNVAAPKTKEIQATVASLRADAVFASGFGVSRTTASKLLGQEKGKCNGMVVTASTVVKAGDICTLRGYGKMCVAKVGGLSKKERICITIEKYI